MHITTRSVLPSYRLLENARLSHSRVLSEEINRLPALARITSAPSEIDLEGTGVQLDLRPQCRGFSQRGSVHMTVQDDVKLRRRVRRVTR